MSWAYSDLVAEVYEFHLPIGYSNGDVEYYLRALNGITGRVLEPACGTGRVLIPLLEAGHRAEGLDHSPEMLDVCRKYCRERGLPEPALYAADMTTFVRPGAYEAVVVPAGSIRNLDGREPTLRALRSFHRSLVPGGRLVLDVAAPRMVTGLPPVEIHQREPYVWTVQTIRYDYDPVVNRTTQFLRYEKWRDGEQVVTELHRFHLQHWGLEEFEELLNEAGFTDVRVSADYQEDVRPGPDSGDWTFHAVRP
ncbi:class I SAM-dependent methyltransferase [Streptomyces sp. NPDC088812]|uniref:class I SAM-dependent methyltransferase n=1 Tax=Streptomyces sp. NPDC088812 TaxID=3365905 RepID=UPI003812CE42